MSKKVLTRMEALEFLDKNPNKKVKELENGDILSFIDGRLCWHEDRHSPFYFAEEKYEDEFEIVEELIPCSVIEAIQARKNGKTIVCRYNNQDREYTPQSKSMQMTYTEEKLLNGEWFIKE